MLQAWLEARTLREGMAGTGLSWSRSLWQSKPAGRELDLLAAFPSNQVSSG